MIASGDEPELEEIGKSIPGQGDDQAFHFHEATHPLVSNVPYFGPSGARTATAPSFLHSPLMAERIIEADGRETDFTRFVTEAHLDEVARATPIPYFYVGGDLFVISIRQTNHRATPSDPADPRLLVGGFVRNGAEALVVP